MRFSCRPKRRGEVIMSHCHGSKRQVDTWPSTGVEQQELPRHYFNIPCIGYFWMLHNGGCANSSTGSVNQLTSSLFIPLLKLRTYSTWKILSLTGFVHALSTNLPVQAVTLVTLAKQSDTFPCSSQCTSTCHRTDGFTFISTYRLQSCRTSCNLDYFKILDSARTRYQVKLKESMHIKWEKPDLNQQVKHINLMLSL